jgi:hypothetical protein
MTKINLQNANNLREQEKAFGNEIVDETSESLKDNLENYFEGINEDGEINIISPTKWENYTLKHVLSKWFERSKLSCDNIEYKNLHRCFYWSVDGIIEVKNLRCSSSIWTDSVDFSITWKIPVHFTENGRMSIWFACGCDSSHGWQYPSQCEPDNKDRDSYMKESGPYAKINISCGDKSQEVSLEEIFDLNWVVESDVNKILRDLLFEVIAVKKLLSDN